MKLKTTLISAGPLTPRESQVLVHLCTGMPRQAIADTLHRSYGAVSKHIESIAAKLDAHGTAQIVAKAVAAKLVEITQVRAMLDTALWRGKQAYVFVA